MPSIATTPHDEVDTLPLEPDHPRAGNGVAGAGDDEDFVRRLLGDADLPGERTAGWFDREGYAHRGRCRARMLRCTPVIATVEGVGTAINGPAGLGLTDAEWSKAGSLGTLATELVGRAPLNRAIAELQTAIAANDKARMVAFATAAEARLRGDAAAAGGKVSLSQRQDEDQLRSLISDARTRCRDRSLDVVRDAQREFSAIVGDVSGAVLKARNRREIQRRIQSGQLVPWPPQRSDRPDGSHAEWDREAKAWV